MNMEEWTALNERVQSAKDTDRRRGDGQATADLITALVEEMNLKTLDGVAIRPNMRVVDYNLKWTTITGIQSVDLHTGIWFATTTGMFDASRLWARMPA